MFLQQLASIQNRLNNVAEQLGQPNMSLPEFHQTSGEINQTAIAVCGMLGRGKSSLINAVFKESLLPEGLSPQIATLGSYYIVVTNTQSAPARMHLSSGVVELDTVTINSSQLEAKAKQIDFIQIYASCSELPENFQLIETPGFPSIDFELKTKSVLERVNNVILIIDANQGLTQDEIEFITSLPTNIRHLFIVASKIDKAPPQLHETFMHRIVEQVKHLDLNIHTRIFKVSIAAIFNQAEGYQWTDLESDLLNLVGSSSSVTEINSLSTRSQATHLLKAAENLQKVLKVKRLRTEELKNNHTTTRKVSELKRTHKLIQDVIDDQAQDILRTVRNSLESVTFQLENDMRAKRTDSQSVKRQLQNWLDREQKRMEERLKRHFRSVLEDTSYAVSRNYTLNVELDEIRVRAVQDINVSPSQTALLAEYVRFGGLGAGALTALVSLLLPGGGFVISLTVGGAIATGTWLLADNVLKSDANANKLPNLTETIIPEFERNLRRNTKRLTSLVEAAFAEAVARQEASIPMSFDSDNIFEELTRIVAELKEIVK